MLQMIIVLLVLILCWGYYRYMRLRAFSGRQVGYGVHLMEENDNLKNALYETEKGRDEQEENYEMQFLSLNEQIAELDKQRYELQEHIDELEAHLEKHDRECIPILGETRWKALSGQVENA